MALSGNFTMRDVQAMFGSSSEPLSTLSSYLNKLTGNNSSGRRLRDLTGYGLPELSSLSASTASDTGGKIDVSFTVNEVNNPEGFTGNWSNVQVQVSEGSGDREPSDWSNVGGTQAYSSAGNKNITNIDVSEDNSTYAVRVKYWNRFNDASSDQFTHMTQQPYPTATSYIRNQFPRPTIDSAMITGSWIYVTWNYGDSPSHFEAQYER